MANMVGDQLEVQGIPWGDEEEHQKAHKMPDKMFINDVSSIVDENLEGLVNSCEHITFHESCCRVVLRSDYKQHCQHGKVSTITGGGSGHEPFPAGMVGKNFLTASVSGNIFASPPTGYVEAALNATRSEGGTILFVINYTGDRLNFGLAAEKFKRNGGKVRIVTVADDIALDDVEHRIGARGLAGAVMVIKIACKMAEDGKSMNEIGDFAEKILGYTATLGVSLKACSLPKSSEMFTVGENKMEIGLGVHGERGVKRERYETVRQAVEIVMDKLIGSEKLEKQLTKGSSAAVLMNNLGGVTQIEMNILRNEIAKWMASHHISIGIFFAGPYMTSLDGHGFSVSIIPLIEDSVRECLESPVCTASFSPAFRVREYRKFEFEEMKPTAATLKQEGAKLNKDEAVRARKCVESIFAILTEKKEELDLLDSGAGDGDCGSTMADAMKAIRRHMDMENLELEYPKTLLSQLGRIFEEEVGGTTGAIYALMLEAGSHSFEDSAFPIDWINGLEKGMKAIMEYGRARCGDRTMVDTLNGVLEHCKTLTENGKLKKGAIPEISKVALESAQSTSSMHASAGRASYTSHEAQTGPDAGAMATAYWIQAIVESLTWE